MCNHTFFEIKLIAECQFVVLRESLALTTRHQINRDYLVLQSIGTHTHTDMCDMHAGGMQ